MSMKYDAVTFDTQVVIRNGFNFSGGLLAQLSQFKNGPTRVVVSQMTVLEVLKHLVENTRAAKAILESAHSKAVFFGLKPERSEAFSGEIDIRSIAKERLNGFINSIGAEVIGIGDLTLEYLLERYSDSSPPFAASGKKKAEFPDAIALFSLEKWAKSNVKHILAVSGDGDWKSYGEQSDFIHVVEKLDDALASLQEHTEEARKIIQHLLVDIKTAKQPALSIEFEKRLDHAVSGYMIHADASSGFLVDADDAFVSYLAYEFVGDQKEYEFEVVQAGPEIIAARITIQLEVRAEAYFSFYVRDEGDYINMGSSHPEKDTEIEVEVLATFEGDFEQNHVDVTDVDIVTRTISIDFGYQGPDYKE